MKPSLTSKLPDRTLGNFALAGSLVLHAGFFALYSSWQWEWRSPQKNPPVSINVKFLSEPPSVKVPEPPVPQKTSKFPPIRPQALHSLSMVPLKARTPELPVTAHPPVPWSRQKMLSPKMNFERRMIQQTSITSANANPVTARPLKTIQHNHNMAHEVKSRPSPALKTHQTKSVQAVAPVDVRGLGKHVVLRRKFITRQADISNSTDTLSKHAFPMETPKPRANHIHQRPVPETLKNAISTEAGPAAQQAAELFISSTKSPAKLAAIPREISRSPGADPDLPEADLIALRGLFTGKVRQRIANAKYYPRIARRRGMEGQPVIAFTLNKDGGLITVNLAQTSGYQLLDQAALEAVHQAAPYPEIPDELKAETFQFKLPISFILK